MGVNISSIISNSKKEVEYIELFEKTIAIDTFNQLYQFLATIRGHDGLPLKNKKGETTSHIVGLFNRTSFLIQHGIKPIFVFDGEINELKMNEINKRRNIKKEAESKMNQSLESENYEDAKKYAQSTSKLTSEMIETSKSLLKAMGCPVVQAAQDGEAQAAVMVQKGLAWAVGSQDYDSILFGSPKLLRNLSMNNKKKFKNTVIDVKIEYYTLNQILEDLNLTRAQMIDLGILVGLDFYEGIKGIGAKTALKHITKYENLEGIVNNNIQVKKEPIKFNFEEITKVRNLFLNPSINEDFSVKWTKPDDDKILEILVEQNNFSKDRVENSIKKLHTTQTSLLKFIK